MPDPTKLLSEEHTVLAIEAALQIPAHFTVDGAYAALNQALATIRTLQAENAEQAKQAEYWRRANDEMRPNLDRACAQRDALSQVVKTQILRIEGLGGALDTIMGMYDAGVEPNETSFREINHIARTALSGDTL